MVQVAPDHCDVQVQVLGAEHVPPFWHGEAQIAERYNRIEIESAVI